MEQAEVLDQPGRAPVRRRTRWLLAALALVLLVGWAVDHRLRGSEERAVDGCGSEAATATERTDESMSMIRTYVQPALLSVPRGSSQDGFFDLVAEEAREAEPRVRDALAVCRDVDVVAVHPGLRERRDAYVAHLAARADWLAAIAADGRAYYHDRPDLARLREAAFGGRS
ncbi:hypothetical protein [Nocardioides marmotae]|uniref:hypothetical protein n=1 Tax=Nocardioides marmotae TaxID=2663857 RepID=UPI0012B60659|nr:hypothetical protein [Nocardioides marmotae]MBC9734594.1 hypothetical protein [Nocardioides marmotae]MTB85695.1 hypothetical protein [Nocardioides marmotae]